MRIKEGLDRVVAEKLVRFEMPGHKGRIEEDIYKYDYTEIPGTDNLTNPKDIILNTMEEIARTFGARASFISVNGASGGLLGSMSAAFRPGDEVIILRKAHISIYDGIYLLGLKPLYIYEDEDYLDQLKSLITPRTRGVVLTSPDYYGRVLDEEVFQWVVERGLILIVDEAHGSHLKLIDEDLSSMKYADLVVHSFHKTLPSMTQSAVVHLCSDRFEKSYLQKNLKLFQSTSPSYLLLRSVDIALDIYKSQGRALMEELLLNCEEFKKKLENATDFYVNYQEKRQDRTRLLITHREDLDYGELERGLRELGIQSEFSSQEGLVMLTSIMNIKEDFDRLLEGLKSVPLVKGKRIDHRSFRPKRVVELKDAFLKKSSFLSFEEALGRVVSEYVIPYPPGSPLIVPGELMDRELIAYLEDFKGELVGLERPGYIGVLDEV